MKKQTLFAFSSMALAIAASGLVNAQEKEMALAEVTTEQRLIEPCLQERRAVDGNERNFIEPIPIDDDCGGGGGGNTGPYVKPGTPASIDYASYARGTFKVSWGASNGYGYPVNYKLYERKNSGAWTQIYSGYGTSRLLSNKTDGSYSYRVSGCNVKGCSTYKTGFTMKVKNLPAAPNYSSMYPGLEASRVGDSTFIAGNKSYRDVTRGAYSGGTALKGATGAKTTSFGFHLGKGFGLTEGDYAPEEMCLKTDDLSVTTTPVNQDQLIFSQVQNSQDLYSKLDLDISADLSLSIGAFGLDADGKYELFRESKMKQDNSRVLIKWQRKAERLDLVSSTPFKLKNYWKSNYINPTDGSDVSETHFRNQCGDQYVKSVTTGARLYVLLEIGNEELSTTEMETTSYNAKLKIASIFNASSSGTISSETRQFFEKHSIQLKVYTEGGSSVNASVQNVSLDNVKAFADNFIAGVTSAGHVALDKDLAYYPVPVEYNHLTHFNVYKDYRPARDNMRRWLSLDHQVNGRCENLTRVDAQAGQSKYRSRCHAARVNMGTHTEYCAVGQQWGDCNNPYNAYGSINGSTVSLMPYLNVNIPSIYSTASQESNSVNIPYFYVSNCGAFCGGRSGTRTTQVCLSNKECLVDESRNYTTPAAVNKLYNHGNVAPIGAEVHVTRMNSPRTGGASQKINRVSGVPCLDSTVTVKSKGWWGGGAWYEGSQSIHGRCPVQENILLP
ncbi:hypothetical protein [Pleionea sp. CnH1-48]|uniref:hypothetical protein n=1 Tax=Pleionea sp. CnH1-48 TaxID=2954494 RepID=UPI00209842BF|nr:hypothetical protein [Pleionea sp. CnH1-48]MCO7224790.1 hypothetical protein [Pleionea sp. CnH1-48]